ncbi:MAG: DUF2975 domain-containing protein [Actinoallomurus sp.]
MTVLQLGIIAVFLAGLFGQIVVLPTTASDEVAQFPPYEPYAVPYVTVAIIGVICVQIALVAMWMLLGLVRHDALFSPRAFRWVDLIIGCSAACTVLAAGVTVHLLVADIPSPSDGMELIGAFGAAALGTGAGVAFIMLMVIMRGLLRKATQLQTEMAEVV